MIGALLTRMLLFAALWFAFAEGDLSGAPIAFGAVLAAAATSLWVSPPARDGERIRAFAVPRFLVYFLRRSAAGGVDVARRALHPRLPISPLLLTYRLSRLGARSRLLFAHVVSLLPGTLCCALDGDVLHVHALDGRAPVADELRRLEDEVARLFAR